MACSSNRSYEDAENKDQQFSIDYVGEILSTYNSAFHLNLNIDKIQPDKFRCHETFKQRQKNTQLDNTGQNSNDENQSTKPNKKQKEPAKCSIKAIRDLKVVRGDHSLISFLKLLVPQTSTRANFQIEISWFGSLFS